jgi:hypothetical protein
MCLFGPSGSGKSYTALCIAKGLGGSILVADSENQSVKNYKGKGKTPEDFSFSAIKIPDGNPKTMIQIIKFAEKNNYDNLIIDSLSYSWTGPDGELDLASQASARMKSSNPWASWKDVTPLHNQLLEAILSSPLNIITTLRSKTEWVKEEVERNGRITIVPKRVGLAPVYKEQSEAEYDLAAEMDSEHRLVITKSRFFPFADRVIMKPGPELGEELRAWMASGSIVDETNDEPVFVAINEDTIATPKTEPAGHVTQEKKAPAKAKKTETKTTEESSDKTLKGAENQEVLNLIPRIEAWLKTQAVDGKEDEIVEAGREICQVFFQVEKLEDIPGEKFVDFRNFARSELIDSLRKDGLAKEK